MKNGYFGIREEILTTWATIFEEKWTYPISEGYHNMYRYYYHPAWRDLVKKNKLDLLEIEELYSELDDSWLFGASNNW